MTEYSRRDNPHEGENRALLRFSLQGGLSVPFACNSYLQWTKIRTNRK